MLLSKTMGLDLKSVLDSAQLGAVRDGAYSLLLGAGASFGATSRDGVPLPFGASYAKELIDRFGLTIKSGTPLQHVWDAASLKAGSESQLRRQSLDRRFTGCIPTDYQRLFATFAWKRIFTFNVDDALPAAYAEVGTRLQEVAEVHFEDAYVDPNRAADQVQLVYLHGAAALTDRKIVFSPPAYADSIKAQNTWLHVFAESFVSDPFIVIGASLQEPDFETYIAQKRRMPNPLAPKSLYVDPHIDDAARAICKRLDLIPVELGGEDFLRQLSDLTKDRERISSVLARQLKPLTVLSSLESLPQLAAIAQQFFLIPKEATKWPTSHRPPDIFYDGYDALWEDIRAHRDVPLQFEADLAQDVRSFLDSKTSASSSIKIAVISDNAGTGKTTALMRVSATLAMEGRAVLFLYGTERFKDETLSSVLSKEKSPLVIAIDRLADHSLQLERFCASYPKTAPRCYIIAAERQGSEQLISDRLSRFGTAFMKVPQLTRPQAEEFARKLRLAAKLHHFSGRSDGELADIFTATRGKAWAGQLLVILLEIVQGRRLLERLSDEWNGLPDECKRFYGAVCIASACGFPIRSARAYSLLQLESLAGFSKSMVDGPLKGLTRWELIDAEYYIKPRHRVIAEGVVRSAMSQQEIFAISLQLAATLATYVNRQSTMRGSPDARLIRQLMDEDGFIVPRFRRRAEEWYAQLQPLCGWNSRYWEQRAMNSMRSGNRHRARDFAAAAVGVERHWQPLTTYARILIDSADNDHGLSKAQKETMLRQGMTLLDEAIKTAASHDRYDVHLYHLVLDASVRVAERLFHDIPAWMKEVIREHATGAQKYFGHRREIKRPLSDLTSRGII